MHSSTSRFVHPTNVPTNQPSSQPTNHPTNQRNISLLPSDMEHSTLMHVHQNLFNKWFVIQTMLCFVSFAWLVSKLVNLCCLFVCWFIHLFVIKSLSLQCDKDTSDTLETAKCTTALCKVTY